MPRKALDPNLASILESIRATLGSGDAAGAPAAAADHRPDRDGQDGEDKAAAGDDPTERGRRAARAARHSFAKSRTVEEFLADLARPYVQSWLADHLPELVQKMVAEEIGRLTGRD